MTDPAPLAHAPSDTPIHRRMALPDLPADDPRRQWELFVRHIDQPATPVSALLRKWLGGRSVEVTDPQTRRGAGRQYRVVTLTTFDGGEALPLCHVSAVVELPLLPHRVRNAVLHTDQSLSSTLLQAGAVCERTTATVLDPDPDAPGDAGLRIRGTYRLPANGGRVVATVEEWFTGYVLQLRGTGRPADVEPPRPLHDVDESVVRLVQQRRVLAARHQWRRRVRSDDGSDQLRQLVHLFRREPVRPGAPGDDRPAPPTPLVRTRGSDPDPDSEDDTTSQTRTTSETTDRQGARQW